VAKPVEGYTCEVGAKFPTSCLLCKTVTQLNSKSLFDRDNSGIG